MKRRLIIGGVIAAAVIAAIWLGFAWAGWRSRADYSGTVETREIEVGSKLGGRVTAVGGGRRPDGEGRRAAGAIRGE
jgi:HlyD family secretion protein